MSTFLHPLALFRLTVLGPLASRDKFQRGEIQIIVQQLAQQTYKIPDSRRVHLSEQTILRWYYDWKKNGIDGLMPKSRADKGQSQLSPDIQKTLLLFKKDNPARSLNTLIQLVEKQGLVAVKKLSRATVHRFLQNQSLSKRVIDNKHTIERRSFNAIHAGDMWQGDVLHGPSIQTSSGMRKVYLVSLMDDASRLIVHSAFCLGETALDIEGVLKQAVLKRGLPHKLIIDNGPAYRAQSLQTVCALLEIRLIYCRPYEPEGKGKLERFHRTFREQFLNEIVIEKITSLDDLNARLWAWLDCVYHQAPHAGLLGKKPIERWREDLVHVRALGFKAEKIDGIFCHREIRLVRKDGSVSWNGKKFEVDFSLVGKEITLIVDPHAKTLLRAESASGDYLCLVTPLNEQANLNRKRYRPEKIISNAPEREKNLVEQVFDEHQKSLAIPEKNELTGE